MARRSKKIAKKSILKFCVIFSMYVVIWVFLVTVAVVISVSRTVPKNSEEPKIPVMEISLNGVTLQEVHENGKEVKYAGNTLSLDGVDYENVEFKGRGNFSWLANKKSYKIKFDRKVDLLGMGKAKKWALIANDIDDTLMRNDYAYYLMDIIVGGYPLRGEFANLVIDGEDLGLYYVIKTMEIDKNAVDLKDEMGILVELDNAYCWEEEKWYETEKGNCLTVKDVVTDDNVEEAMADFMNDFEEFEKAVEEGDMGTVNELVDLESFAEFFIVSELTANPDAFVTSWFMYKDGIDDKIHAGLAWDFDAAFGNNNWGQWPDEFYAPTTALARMEYTFKKNEKSSDYCNYSDEVLLSETVTISRTMCEMMNELDFRNAVSEIYRKRVEGKEEIILDYISKRASEIREDAIKDKAFWGDRDFDLGVEYLKDWMKKRLEFFKERYLII